MPLTDPAIPPNTLPAANPAAVEVNTVLNPPVATARLSKAASTFPKNVVSVPIPAPRPSKAPKIVAVNSDPNPPASRIP